MPEEKVPIVDEHDNIINHVSRKEMRQKNLLHRAIAVFVFNSKNELFVHQRSFQKDAHPGYYDTQIAGVVSEGESYYDTAKRELQEELGIKANPVFLFKIRQPGKESTAFFSVYKCIVYSTPKLQTEEIIHGNFMELQDVKELIKKEKFPERSVVIFKKFFEEYAGNETKR